MKMVDLFSGCGGFSLGAKNAGFDLALSVDNDPILSSSYEDNFPSSNLVLTDIKKMTGRKCLELAGGEVDGIIGGPPCQGFSTIGKRQANDPRRNLLIHFFRIVSEVQPKFFVMENVEGVIHNHSVGTLNQGLGLVEGNFDILGPIVLNAADFGAATSRPRVFVFGTRNDLKIKLEVSSFDSIKRPASTVKDALHDLANAKSINGLSKGFDFWKLNCKRKPSAYAKDLRAPNMLFTGNTVTKHTEVVRNRFATVKPGESDTVGRHPRLKWSGQAPTLRAGTGPDKGSFQSLRPIHPDEDRVINVREAARLQGFPDDFLFHPTIWHSFRMIGNSVSPILASSVLSLIKEKIDSVGK